MGRHASKEGTVNAMTTATIQAKVHTAITGRGSVSALGSGGGCGSVGIVIKRSPHRLSYGSAVLRVVDVTDPGDVRLDDFRDLNSIDRRPDLPSGKALVIGEGVLVVQRMLASRFAPFALLGTDRRLGELRDDLAAVEVPFYRVEADVMAQVVGFHLNRGVLAAARRPPTPTVRELFENTRTLAVLEGVNDHENLGSIFRNAAGLGVDAVIFGPGCADPLYRRAVRVSMGHALLVPYARAENWLTDLKLLRKNGFHLLAMTPDTQAVTLADAMARVADDKVAIMVGAEGHGLSQNAMRVSDMRVRIPMSRATDSLNVATAAALAFYERARLAAMSSAKSIQRR
jgi:tRNA G18 (ribose-2'-O)-methylase SpoU